MATLDATNKTDFDEIYNQPDPRQYYATLEPYEYVIPVHGAQMFAELVRARSTSRGQRPARLLDLCCSYGIVGLLLKTDLGMKDLYAHYSNAHSLDSAAVAAEDRHLLSEHRCSDAPEVIGLDVAENAVDYALSTGALDGGGAENLEMDDPSDTLVAELSDIDLVTTTGGVGYITEKTFSKLLAHTPPSAWVASFCLRTYDYTPIADELSAHDLQTESLEQTFRQRRFVSEDERRWATEEVRALGRDPRGMEDTGFLHASFHLSRPADEVVDRPLAQLLSN